MAPDDTLLVQSGKPVGVMRTHERAPRVLIANSLLVPKWATPEYFRELEDLGLIMYGQMTAGSWIYIGTQGILQGTFATFAEVANQHFDGTLAGTITLTGGLGGMGGAQPLAVTGNGGVALCVEVDPWRLQRRIEHRYLDEQADDLDDAIARCEAAKRERRPLSVGLVAQLRRRAPELVRRGWTPDIVTDQTSAHDALNGYVPHGVTLDEALELRRVKPEEYIERSTASMAVHCQAMLDFQTAGAVVFDYGNGLRGQAQDAGVANAFDYPGFVVAYIRPLFARGAGPFRWACLSGSDADLAATDDAVAQGLPGRRRSAALAPLRTREGALPRPALADLLARLRRTSPGRAGVQRPRRQSGAVSAPDRDRPRPPRRRQRRVARARDRGHARRVGRDRRLADPQRAGEHRVRCVVGVGAPRRRGRDRQVDPRRRRRRRRRHRGRRLAPGAGAHQRPRHGGHPACRRRLRDRHRHRPRVGVRMPMEEGTHAPDWQR